MVSGTDVEHKDRKKLIYSNRVKDPKLSTPIQLPPLLDWLKAARSPQHPSISLSLMIYVNRSQTNFATQNPLPF